MCSLKASAISSIFIDDAVDLRDIEKMQFHLNDKLIMANWLLHIAHDHVNFVEIRCFWKICIIIMQHDSGSYIKILT
jgi:hypothetical protein